MVTYMLPSASDKGCRISGSAGRQPICNVVFRVFEARAPSKARVALDRIAQGNLANVKGVGGGLLEYRIDYGPGYRIHFGRDGDQVVIRLCGGTKKRQQADIDAAQERWRDYKLRKGS
jgi:putative addiction module killer protein